MITSRATAVPRWRPLTTELRSSTSPVTRFIKQRFANIREVQWGYRDDVGPLIVESTGNPGTVGAAFDWAVRFLVHPQPSVYLALRGVVRRSPTLTGAAIEMATDYLGIVVNRDAADAQFGVARFYGPGSGGSAVEEPTLLRGCWALGLLTETYRLRGLVPNSPLTALDREGVRATDLLSLAPDAALVELAQLRRLAQQRLLPPLAHRRGQWAIGPTFEGSKLINADADLIGSGLLIELKTGQGKQQADGGRSAGLDWPSLQQLLGYLLLDFTDEFAIDQVGLYAARYGHLAT